MIAGPRRGWAALRPLLGPTLAVLLAWDILVAVLYVVFHQRWLAVNDLPISLIGSALALLVTLRNNSAYARWWEARQLCGTLINASRTLARQVRLHLPGHPDGATVVHLQIAYAQALRLHLRRQPFWPELDPLVPADPRLRTAPNLPDALLAAMADRLAAIPGLDSVRAAAFDATLATLGNVQGGCERIKNTPLPRQYTLLPRVFIQLFCALLPLAMVTDLGLATPLGSALLGLFFLTLDRMGADLEDPFHDTIHDVPLTALTRTIEIDLRQSLGETDLPPPIVPKAGVLW